MFKRKATKSLEAYQSDFTGLNEAGFIAWGRRPQTLTMKAHFY